MCWPRRSPHLFSSLRLSAARWLAQLAAGAVYWLSNELSRLAWAPASRRAPIPMLLPACRLVCVDTSFDAVSPTRGSAH